MPKAQLSTLITLVKRSKDIKDGWRQCSDICWSLVLEYEDDSDTPFEYAHGTRCVRLKSEPKKKSTIDDLMNQIEDWRQDTLRELAARERAENMFSDS